MVTEDVGLATYAAARSDLDVAPLPWDRTYLLLSRDTTFTLGGRVEPDAVRADARMAEPAVCDTSGGDAAIRGSALRAGQVVYDAGDRTAREIAERVVALMDGDASARGMTAAELDVALRAGEAVAYIISLARNGRCDALAALSQQAGWLRPRAAHPLLDTRVHAIMPRSTRP
jgi:hypothetical protein